MFLPRDHEEFGAKKLSFVYCTTRIAFLVKMLNHDVEIFSFIARQSLKLDMKKRKYLLLLAFKEEISWGIN